LGLGSDVDDHDASLLAVSGGWSRRGRVTIASRALEGNLDPALLAPALLLFASQDLFDDPGIQHLLTAFRQGVLL
jgi:hypothetical protein